MVDLDKSVNVGVFNSFLESLIGFELDIRFIQLILPLATLTIYKDFKLIKSCYA